MKSLRGPRFCLFDRGTDRRGGFAPPRTRVKTLRSRLGSGHCPWAGGGTRTLKRRKERLDSSGLWRARRVAPGTSRRGPCGLSAARGLDVEVGSTAGLPGHSDESNQESSRRGRRCRSAGAWWKGFANPPPPSAVLGRWQPGQVAALGRWRPWAGGGPVLCQPLNPFQEREPAYEVILRRCILAFIDHLLIF